MKKFLICVLSVFFILGITFSSAQTGEYTVMLESETPGYDSMCSAIYDAVTLSLAKKGVAEHGMTVDMLKQHIADRGQQGEIITVLEDGVDKTGYTAEYLLAGMAGLENTGVAVTGMYRIDMSKRDEIKQAINNYGGVLISYEYKGTNTKGDDSRGEGKKSLISRQAVITGWDDDYSASAFGSSENGSGAWLIKDSIFDGGYSYISYYDSSIGNTAIAIDCSLPDYDKAYQFDGGYTHDKDVCFGHTGYMCNMFISNREEALEYASFFVNSNENVDYEVRVYLNPSWGKNPASGYLANNEKKGLLVSGTTTKAGYYTVKFKEPIMLNKDDEFAIVVRLKSNENVYLPLDTDGTVKGTHGNDIISCEANSYKEQSYISMDGISWEEISLVGNMNLRIKAFTRKVNTPSGNGRLIAAIIIVTVIFGGYFLFAKNRKRKV